MMCSTKQQTIPNMFTILSIVEQHCTLTWEPPMGMCAFEGVEKNDFYQMQPN